MTKAAKLAQAAAAAAEVRAHQTNPDVAALAIERVRTIVTALIWCGVVTFLAFTAVNVQQFYAAGSKGHGPAWWVAWVVDPAIAMFLIAMLIAEQVLSRYQIKSGGWVRALKWGAFAATYAMNTWSAWGQNDVAAIVKHSIPPLLVVVAAEAVTQARHGLSEAIQAAHARARQRLADRSQDRSPAVPEPVPGPDASGPQDHAEAVPGPVPTTVQDRSQDHDETVLAEPQDRSPKRSQDRRRTTPRTAGKATAKTASAGRVTQAEWENRIRQAVADHPGIDLNPSPIAAVLNLDTKTRGSGGFKRAVTAVREELDATDHRLRAVNE